MDDVPLKTHDAVRMAINKSPYTVHSFAQLMGIKLAILESYIDVRAIPENKTIKRMNRFLNPIKIKQHNDK